MTHILNHRRLVAILLIAVGLRAAYGLSQGSRLAPGGDSLWYLANGYALVANRSQINGFPIELSRLPTAPLYLLFVGLPQVILPPETAIIAIRVVQAIMGAAICWFAYRLALALTGDERAGLLAAGVLAISPVFVIEPAQILTETLYMFLVTAGLTLYVEWSAHDEARPLWMLAASGALLGLAALTRAVLLLFPLGLALHLLMLCGGRAGLKRAALLLAVYALVVSTWTIYNLARWNRLVIGAEGFAAFLYLGAKGWEGPNQVDQNLAQDLGADPGSGNDQRQEAFAQVAAETISGDPLGWMRRRAGELAGAYLQPHGTLFFPGEGLKDLALNWLRADRSFAGLLRLTQGEQFWPKLVVYLFHYAGLAGGLAGMWLYRRRWQVTLPLVGFIAYTTLIHLVLLALPRYLFPTEVFWWVFASIWLVAVADRVRRVGARHALSLRPTPPARS